MQDRGQGNCSLKQGKPQVSLSPVSSAGAEQRDVGELLSHQLSAGAGRKAKLEAAGCRDPQTGCTPGDVSRTAPRSFGDIRRNTGCTELSTRQVLGMNPPLLQAVLIKVLPPLVTM